MVGEGVLHECLNSPAVEKVLIINRKPLGVTHPKLTEIIHEDFFDLSAVEPQLAGYNACFFCLGVSSVGMDKEQYRKLTYDLTLYVANVLVRLNPNMVFAYVSGGGTDSSEKGVQAWARVKGKTENDLMKLPFKAAYMFRPGFIRPTPGLTKAHGFYRYINWLFPIARAISPGLVCTMGELGQAMINAVRVGYKTPILESKDIVALAKAV